MKRSPAVWLLISLAPGAAIRSADEDPVLRDARSAAKLLLAVGPPEREEGLRQLREHDSEYLAALLRGIAAGDLEDKALAAETASIFVSPWLQGKKHTLSNSIPRYVPRRPVERAPGHPWAARLRHTALAELRGLLTAPRWRAAFDEEERIVDPSYARALELVCELLVEVVDEAALGQLVELAAAEKRAGPCFLLAKSVAACDGLPSGFEAPPRDCGDVPTREELLREHRKEAAAVRQWRDEVLAWHRRYAAGSVEDRAEATLQPFDDVLEKRRRDGERPRLDPFDPWHSHELLDRPLRHGAAIVPALELRKTWAQDLETRVILEKALATIRGELDEELVRQLFADKGRKDWAVEIVIAAGSRKWRRELQAMLQDADVHRRKLAEEALAVLHPAP